MRWAFDIRAALSRMAAQIDNELESLRDAITLPVLPSYTVATVPTEAGIGGLIYVTDETGGAVPAFWDGTDWRRVTDRAVVS